MIEPYLKLPRIEAIPKDVQLLSEFSAAWSGLCDGDKKIIADLIADIFAGRPIDEARYRKGVDTNEPRDHVLELEGYIHLHFSTVNDDLLIYLRQYPTFVVFTTIDTHALLAKPHGVGLRQRYSHRVRAIAALKASQLSERAAAGVKGIVPGRATDSEEVE